MLQSMGPQSQTRLSNAAAATALEQNQAPQDVLLRFQNLPASVWWIHHNEPNTRDLAGGTLTHTGLDQWETNGTTAKMRGE